MTCGVYNALNLGESELGFGYLKEVMSLWFPILGPDSHELAGLD